MTSLRRRTLLKQTFLAAAATTPAARSLSACLEVSSHQQMALPTGPLWNIGSLQPVNGLGLSLAKGCEARLLAVAGDRVVTPGGVSDRSDYSWHTYPDGGAVFARTEGGWVYTSNSEVPMVPLGGCGAISFNKEGVVDSAYSILSGTTQNCAGGTTPWQTWISCEESRDGQCFECDPFAPGQGQAKPALGIFAHEAFALDERRATAYLTEDTRDGRFYRWVADPEDRLDNGRLRLEKGRLQVMNIAGYADDCYPESDALVRGQLPVSWVDLSSPELRQDKHRGRLRRKGKAVPGTTFAGGEGLWQYTLPASVARTLQPKGGKAPDSLIFWTTKYDNRVWCLDVANQAVELIFDNSQIDEAIMSVDNLTVSPWGDILVAEDPSKDVARLIILNPNQGAKTLLEIHHPGSEICGPAFSPDGSRLYFSSQRYRKGGATYEVILPKELLPTAA
ncbi:sugar lactone lactonase YvrE [Litorivivens lipolytica]|uniref:Sugar lactone lactonase YvrE n=1 Tax=Litorivivens lipolytica TaxID=1524264 RepID=A0A7W4W3P3_9GAMM|nr:alkaline phosphatase PhoX [Litorivivens lipolytica]MBB3046319.1 sugar lactone lactonase YvrE [Litorivivens lipolytica]